jgi:sarcosine oxidase
MSNVYDVIVIGVGGMGSATAMHLAKRGKRVLGLEQFGIAHDMGSSHGTARLIRLAYKEHPDYVPLLRRTYELWRDLESGYHTRLLHITGGLDMSRPDGPVAGGALATCIEHELPHEVLTPAEVSKRYPGISLPDDFVAVFQPDSGFVLAEQSIIAHVAAAHDHGADIRAHEPVTAWNASASGDGVTVATARGTYEAASLVITAGAWASKLIPGLGDNARPQRQVLGFFQPQEPALFSTDRFPVFVLDGEEGHFYGHGPHGVPGFKIGKFRHREQWTDPDNQQREIEDEDEAVLRSAVARYFPKANGSTLSLVPCMFTMTPDKFFIIDMLPETPQVSIAAGFSGHGYKFCPVVGEVMADLATERSTRHDIAMFSLSRFADAGAGTG